MSKLRLAIVALLIACGLAIPAFAQGDPLPSWNDGRARQAILDFVAKVTREGGPDFVRPAERIATFDNDGTLWAEQPAYFQLLFAFDEVKRLVAETPALKSKEPYRSVLARDLKGLTADGNKGLLQVVALTHAGMTTDAFNASVDRWLTTARHPTKQRPYTEMSTSRSSSCWPICAPTASRPSSSRAAASSSCASSPRRSTAFRPNRSSARPGW